MTQAPGSDAAEQLQAQLGRSEDISAKNLIVVGASAGGVEALRALVAGFPQELPAAVLIVLHLPAGGTSALAPILKRAGPLEAEVAKDGAVLEQGKIYVASPDHHLLVDEGHALLALGPSENGHRPAINALFRSAAISAGNRAVGVLLSGSLDDGVAGLGAIAARGGATIVQSPEEALYPAMPENALRRVAVNHVLPVADIAELLVRLTVEPKGEPEMDPDHLMELENRIARGTPNTHRSSELGPPSGYVCPDCSGSLMELGGDKYRCRVGHAWSGDALLQARDRELEQALWAALRSLDEKSSLAQRMSESASGGETRMAQRYRQIEAETTKAAAVLRSHLSGFYGTAAAHGEDGSDAAGDGLAQGASNSAV